MQRYVLLIAIALVQLLHYGCKRVETSSPNDLDATMNLPVQASGTGALPSSNDLGSIDEISKAYLEAKSANDKLMIAIYAIEKKYITRGTSIAAVDSIFQSDFQNEFKGPPIELNATHWVVIDFEKSPAPPPISQNDYRRVSAVFVGWYLAIEFNSDMEVNSYYISNLHK